ncbi:hypothetical protein pb186bvf_016796 [Paramecium bursaria]
MNRPSHASNNSIEMEFMKNEDAESIDNYYRDYVDQQQKSSIPQLFLLILQNCLSSLRAPLYIRLGPNPLTRAAWRSGFIALLYFPSLLKQIFQNKSQFYGILNHQKQFIILSISQAIYVLSLSIAIQYTHVSYALMFFNSQLLIHCAFKGKSMNRFEFIGFLACVVLFIAIIRNHNFTFYQKDELSDLDHIVKGDLVALIGGAVFQQIYARYYTELLANYNPGILSGISRILSSFILYLVTQAFEDTTDFTQFVYDSSIFIEIFCNALFTGYLPNQIQIIVEKHFIPLTYNSFAAFQPTIGSVYSYLLGQESFPSFYTLLSTVLVWCIFMHHLVRQISFRSVGNQIRLNKYKRRQFQEGY